MQLKPLLSYTKLTYGSQVEINYSNDGKWMILIKYPGMFKQML